VKFSCFGCGVAFEPTAAQARRATRTNGRVFCSSDCRTTAGNSQKKMHDCKCEGCGKEFQGKLHQVFCSDKCRLTAPRIRTLGRVDV
jgi:hypothetical protein